MSQKKVVLLRSNPVNPDPPVEKMAETLLENGYDVIIVCWDRNSDIHTSETKEVLQNGREKKIVRFGIPAIYGGGLKATLKPFLKFQKYLKRWLKENQEEYDIIHAFDFDTGFVAKRIAKKYKKKFVYHILDFYVDSHSSGGKILRSLVKKAEFSVINGADATIVCTEKRKEQIKGSAPKKLYVIHNTPKTQSKNSSSLQVEKNNLLKIAYVGVFGEGRMIRELLEIVEKDKEIELHIGGFGLLDDTIKEFATANNNIFYYGKMAYHDTLALEEQCDVMTAIYDPQVPNHRFAAPNKFYEAMMLGKPLMMAYNTGFDEMIKEKQLGVLIEYSKDGLKQGLEFLKQKKEEFTLFQQRNKDVYNELFSWKIMEERILQLYMEI